MGFFSSHYYVYFITKSDLSKKSNVMFFYSSYFENTNCSTSMPVCEIYVKMTQIGLILRQLPVLKTNAYTVRCHSIGAARPYTNKVHDCYIKSTNYFIVLRNLMIRSA
jgi:hypothetical protein